MNAYSLYWKRSQEFANGDDFNRGTTIVVAESLTKAIACFQTTYHPARVIETVSKETEDVMIDGK
jgi:hypothetical protein